MIRFPAIEWKELGRFTAQNVKEIQAFEFEKKEVYKYLRINFNTHYGNEFYCPVTVVKVYGYTLVEDLREQVELSQVKLQNFNKLMYEATKSRKKMNLEELPAFPEINQGEKTHLSSSLLTTEMADLMEAFIDEIDRHTPQDDQDNQFTASTNIFADLASHGLLLGPHRPCLVAYSNQLLSNIS